MEWLSSIIGIVVGFGLKTFSDVYTGWWTSKKKHDDIVFKLFMECVNNAEELEEISTFLDKQSIKAQEDGFTANVAICTIHKMLVEHGIHKITSDGWNRFLQIELSKKDRLLVAEGINVYKYTNKYPTDIVMLHDAVTLFVDTNIEYNSIHKISNQQKSSFMMNGWFILRLLKEYKFLRKPQLFELIRNDNFDLLKIMERCNTHLENDPVINICIKMSVQETYPEYYSFRRIFKRMLKKWYNKRKRLSQI